jgi:hypothetical protein
METTQPGDLYLEAHGIAARLARALEGLSWFMASRGLPEFWTFTIVVDPALVSEPFSVAVLFKDKASLEAWATALEFEIEVVHRHRYRAEGDFYLGGFPLSLQVLSDGA